MMGAGPVTQLQHALGIGPIRVGHALAGYDTARRLPRPSARPATWGQLPNLAVPVLSVAAKSGPCRYWALPNDYLVHFPLM